MRANSIKNIKPINRFGIAILAAVVAAILCRSSILETVAAIAWHTFAIVFLFLDWFIMFTTNHHFINKKADEEDGSRGWVFFANLLLSCLSIVGVIYLITQKSRMNLQNIEFVFITVPSLLLSWFLVHTSFTFHYARMYYRSHPQLKFADDVAPPDYLDFAYFSFGIGCTFQTADVSINGKQMRRTVLWHSLLSFLINTFIVALTINIVAGLVN